MVNLSKSQAFVVLLAALEVTDFDLIDFNKHQGEIAALRAEQKALEESNDAVKPFAND